MQEPRALPQEQEPRRARVREQQEQEQRALLQEQEQRRARVQAVPQEQRPLALPLRRALLLEQEQALAVLASA